MIFDGSITNLISETISSSLTHGGNLSLPSHDSIHLGSDTSIIFETEDMNDASPSIVNHCGLVHCGPDVVTYETILDSWFQSARSRFALSSHGLILIQTMAKEVFKNIFLFMKKRLTNALEGDFSSQRYISQTHHGITEITSFCNILSALFETYIPKSLTEKAEEYAAKNNSSNRSSRAGEFKIKEVSKSGILKKFSLLTYLVRPLSITII